MTIISNSKQFIFLHLHKCGGSSVEVAYQPHAQWNDLVIGSTDAGERLQPIYRKLHGLHKHNTATEIRTIVGEEIWERYWTFSMVRHPVSIYESFYRWQHKIYHNYAEKQNLPVDEVKRQILAGESDAYFRHYDGAKPFARAEDFNDFAQIFVRKSILGTLFDRLGDGDRVIVDTVFKLEENAQLWAALSARAEIGVEPHLANKGADVGELRWSAESLALAHEKHAVDYERFGYRPDRDRN